ncbi:MAG TPA: alpha/beta hydrolase [Solirubrobacteraceae bacterium]|nr:alpha/beta hydrolase [Solirubrobacteraceae bacterium]
MPVTTPTASVPVRWEEDGRGEALVLLHGLGGDIGFWEAETEAFRARFRTIRIELRGSGGTPASPGGHTMDDLADDVAAVLDDAGVAQAHVLGFSMGGNVAQAFALRHPQRLGRLVLASTFATMNAQARRFLDAVCDVYAGGVSAKQMFDLVCPWLFSIGFSADPRHAVYFAYPEDEEEPPREDWVKLYRAQQAFDAVGALPDIAARTLVVAGEEDRLVSLDDAGLLAARIGEARLHVIAGSGHLCNVERPHEFQSAVQDFLTAP